MNWRQRKSWGTEQDEAGSSSAAGRKWCKCHQRSLQHRDAENIMQAGAAVSGPVKQDCLFTPVMSTGPGKGLSLRSSTSFQRSALIALHENAW